MRRVVKLGGSLFGFSNLKRNLNQWLEQQTPAQNVLVCGGGKFVDEIRVWRNRFGLNEETEHWCSIEMMDLGTRLASSLVRNCRITDSIEELEPPKNETFFFRVGKWLGNRPQAGQDSIPVSRDFTSDSISALLCNDLNCEELVLLKSCSAPNEFESLADSKIVDPYFLSCIQNSNLRILRIQNVRNLDDTERVFSFPHDSNDSESAQPILH